MTVWRARLEQARLQAEREAVEKEAVVAGDDAGVSSNTDASSFGEQEGERQHPGEKVSQGQFGWAVNVSQACRFAEALDSWQCHGLSHYPIARSKDDCLRLCCSFQPCHVWQWATSVKTLASSKEVVSAQHDGEGCFLGVGSLEFPCFAARADAQYTYHGERRRLHA